MQSGDLDHEVRIYRKVRTTDDFGITDSVELYDTDWANRKDLRTVKDSERTMDKLQRVALGVVQFTFRYRNDLTSDMHFLDEEDSRFNVIGTAIMIGRRQFVSINCEARDND
jgi:head-tail adaptor